MPFPQDLHFIWVGGRRPLKTPTKGEWFSSWVDLAKAWKNWAPTVDYSHLLHRILEWKKRVKPWNVHLWVETDRSITPEAASTLTSAGVQIHDITEVAGDFKAPWARYLHDELCGQNANFGAASDLLRVAILLQRGGLYTDLDNFPDKRIQQLNTLSLNTDLCIGVFTNPEVPNNAALASNAGNAFMQDYLDSIVTQYERLYDAQGEEDLVSLYGYDAESAGPTGLTQAPTADQMRNWRVHHHRIVDRLDTTLNISGPRLLRWCLARHFYDYTDTLANYLQEMGDMMWADQTTDLIRRGMGIPTDVIRITSENSWGGAGTKKEERREALSRQLFD
ncbi:hypothetical protein LZ198_03540 [Myxococcus sp. K15C18031901]|uniref:glycosyltransferase n=1 Tax=Myxococcus dinghuensis TaxID=2906761 RepID=UPI0020A7E08F|nr:glycosyltransferase [Myxococcus dinghuensis]MCP3097945.1 hypothetical protein [Myxococcus dinghuensis]